MIRRLLKRLARWIWTGQVAREYSAQLAHHGWTWEACKALAQATADNYAEDGDSDGWLFGRHRTPAAMAVSEELSCWSE